MVDLPLERRLALAAAGRTAGLGLLVLFGSRARGAARASSDWDFAYFAAPEADLDGLLLALVTTLDTERVDLTDLARGGALLRYHVARDGVALFEAEPDTFDRFRRQAIAFWCDVEPILRPAYAVRLAAL